jgi:hypothetical protein
MVSGDSGMGVLIKSLVHIRRCPNVVHTNTCLHSGGSEQIDIVQTGGRSVVIQASAAHRILRGNSNV